MDEAESQSSSFSRTSRLGVDSWQGLDMLWPQGHSADTDLRTRVVNRIWEGCYGALLSVYMLLELEAEWKCTVMDSSAQSAPTMWAVNVLSLWSSYTAEPGLWKWMELLQGWIIRELQAHAVQQEAQNPHTEQSLGEGETETMSF